MKIAGSIHAFNTFTQAEEWSVANPEHGVTNIAVGDVDGNGTADLLWGAGATSSGSDRLYVANWRTGTIIWQNQQLDGPFVGPVEGDLDGDGVPEIVVASTTSESGYESGRIVVIDGSTLKVRAISPGIAGGWACWTGVHDLKLGDIDGDGRPEILVAGDWLYDGLIEAYKFDASNQFTLVWTNVTRPSSTFYSVASGDVDGDGKIEIIGGSGKYVYAYDSIGAEKWHTLQMGTVIGLAIDDTDDDGIQEIVGMVGNGDVYVFDGTTHALEALIPAAGTCLSLASTSSSMPSIVIGDATGWMSAYAFNGTSYQLTSHKSLATTALDGITFTNSGLWAGANGVLTRYDNGVASYHTANYGIPLGASIIMGQPRTLSAGSYGVHAFRTQP